jgi:flagellar motor switch protein FliN/FliY
MPDDPLNQETAAAVEEAPDPEPRQDAVATASLEGPPSAPEPGMATLEYMLDLPLDVTVELGRTTMLLGEALALQAGSIIELNRLPGEPLDMHLNDRLVARGEVVVVNDALALRITEVVNRGRR